MSRGARRTATTPSNPMTDGLRRISIVTPSFNQGSFIERAITSVLDQDYPDLEYIVVDGGSRDGSVETIKKYGSRLSYWVSEPDRGQSDAINKGLDRSTGEILGWLNSDDAYQRGALLRVGVFFRDHPEADVVYGDAYIVDEEDQVIEPLKSVRFSRRAAVYGGLNLTQPSMFWRRDLFLRVGPLDISLYYGMDDDLWLRFLQHDAKFVYLPSPLSRSRQHPESKTVKDPEAARDEDREVVYRRFGVRRSGLVFSFWRSVYAARRLAYLLMHREFSYVRLRLLGRLNGTLGRAGTVAGR